MFRSLCLAAAVCAIVLNFAASGQAQGRMGMNSTSAFGGGGLQPLGQAGFGASRFGSSGFGSSGMSGFGSNFGSGMSGFGMGGGGFGSSGRGGMGMSGFGNQMMGGMGMNGGAMGGQNFVGRDSSDMSAVMSQMGRAGTQFFNTMSQNMRGRNNRNRQQANEDTGENKRPDIRIRLELGFTPLRPAPAALARTLQTRIASLAVDHSLGQPQIAVEGDTVVLRGVAESETQMLVLANLVSLEPGVRTVRNEMTLAGAPAVAAPVTAVPAATTPGAVSPAVTPTAGTAPAAN
jgi:hypothetical protein